MGNREGRGEGKEEIGSKDAIEQGRRGRGKRWSKVSGVL